MAKAPADLRSLARAHTELGIQTLAGIARNSTSDTARVSAAQALLDRSWGKAAHRRGRQGYPHHPSGLTSICCSTARAGGRTAPPVTPFAP